MTKRFILAVVAATATVVLSYGQSYMDRAETFSQDSLSRLVRNQDLWFEWYGSEGEFFSYSDETPQNRQFVLTETKTGKSFRFNDRKQLQAAADSIISGRGGQIPEKP